MLRPGRFWLRLLWIFSIVIPLASGAMITGKEDPTPLEDPSLFGNLDQHDLTGCNLACGPAAFVESLVFLQRKYPSFYTDPLINLNVTPTNLHDQEVALGNMLCTSMQCRAPNGTAFPNFVTGKQDYFASKKNPATNVITFINPSVDQLAAELNANEDVEILMNFGDPTFRGHYVALYDISFNILDQTGTMKYIDPLDGKPHESNLLGNGAEAGYFVDYIEPNGTKHTGGVVVRAASESPTPEAESVFLFAGGLGLLMILLIRPRLRWRHSL